MTEIRRSTGEVPKHTQYLLILHERKSRLVSRLPRDLHFNVTCMSLLVYLLQRLRRQSKPSTFEVNWLASTRA